MIAQHSTKTNEHYTPEGIVLRGRQLLGRIDLDPASCLEANQTVKASKIFTIADDGLAQTWNGRVFLNPPGGRLKGKRGSQAAAWWAKLIQEWIAGNVECAFFVGFTLEILRTSQNTPYPVQLFPRCYPKQRIEFRGSDPTHANVLVYVPPKDQYGMLRPVADMRRVFEDLGFCE